MTVGRPTIYTKELADRICSELAEGRSLRNVCEDEGMPNKSTVFNWLRSNKDFQDQYALAKEQGTDAWNEELADLGDTAIDLAQTVNEKAASAVVQAVKLKADNLKWAMSKMKPKKYGDKLDMTTNGKDLPTPLLNVLHNRGNKKDIRDDEKV